MPDVDQAAVSAFSIIRMESRGRNGHAYVVLIDLKICALQASLLKF